MGDMCVAQFFDKVKGLSRKLSTKDTRELYTVLDILFYMAAKIVFFRYGYMGITFFARKRNLFLI
jgi:hypothetical protein